MKPKKMRSLQEELFQCITLLLIGLANLSGAPLGVQVVLGLLLVLATLIYAYQKHKYDDLSPEEQRDISREEQDERYLMVRDRAAWLTWGVETWLIWGTAAVSILIAEEETVFRVLIWIFILRSLFWFAAHWWVDRNF